MVAHRYLIEKIEVLVDLIEVNIELIEVNRNLSKYNFGSQYKSNMSLLNTYFIWKSLKFDQSHLKSL